MSEAEVKVMDTGEHPPVFAKLARCRNCGAGRGWLWPNEGEIEKWCEEHKCPADQPREGT